MNNIRVLREEKGWTVRTLANRAGIPFQTVSNYEHGTEPALSRARKVAKALNKPLDKVFPPAAEG